jgi:hypothetical protein
MLPALGHFQQARPKALVPLAALGELVGLERGLAGVAQYLVAQPPATFLKGQAPDDRGQGVGVLVTAQTAQRTDGLAIGDLLQNPVQGGGGRSEQEHALAADGGLGDDLGDDARFAGTRRPLEEKDVRRVQGLGHGRPLPGVQGLVQYVLGPPAGRL